MKKYKISEVSDNVFVGYESRKRKRKGANKMPSEDIGSIGSVILSDLKEPLKVKFWGYDNLLPQRREELAADSNLFGQLFTTKRNIILGSARSGFIALSEKIDEKGDFQTKRVKMPKASELFFLKNKMQMLLMAAVRNMCIHGNFFIEFCRNIDNQIATVKVIDSKYIRCEEQNIYGEIEHFLISGDWSDLSNFPPTRVAAYNGVEEGDAVQEKFIIQYGDNILGDGYYYTPSWQGGMKMIEIAISVINFHYANIENGASPRLHIETPKDYFVDYTASEQEGTEAEIAENMEKVKSAKEQFVRKVNEYFAGAANAGRTFISTYNSDPDTQKDWGGIKISPIAVDLKDEAMLRLFDAVNDASLSATGVPPSLAAIRSGGKFNSGSEIRNEFLMFTAIATPVPRAILCEFIEFVKLVNGWDTEVFFGFADIEIKTLDSNEKGKTEVLQQPKVAE